MGFLAFWPLAFLVLIPAIILLYILKQEAKSHPFSSTMLWQEVFHNIEATKPWEKLKKNILLILQLITVILLILAMMGPWLRSIGKEQRQVVLVLDNSASMGTLYEREKTRLMAAQEAACDYIDSLPQNSVMHVIVGNQSASLILSNSTDKTEAKHRIREIKQTAFAGTLSNALGLVQSCANQAENPDVIFFTDTAFEMNGLKASVASFYNGNENVSVDGIGCSKKGEQYLVLVQLTNYAQHEVAQEINLYGLKEDFTEQLLGIEKVQLDADASASVFLEIPLKDMQEMKALRAELNQKDALLADNVARYVLETAKTNKVLLVTESNLFLEKALTNLSGIDVYRTSDKDAAKNATDYDLYIFDGIVPESLPANGSFLFVNCEYPQYFSSEEKVSNQYITLLNSEVTSYVADTQIGVNRTFTYHLPAWGSSYMNADGKCAGFYGIFDGHKIAVMGFDLHQTDFCLQAAFPILISNLADYLLNGSLVEKDSYIVGESVVLHGSTRGEDLEVLLPDRTTERMTPYEASGSYFTVDQMGICRVSQNVEGELRTQMFSVGFPVALESHVESADQMTVGEQGAGVAQIHNATLEIRNYILAVLLLLMMAEWVIYLKLR